LLMGDLLILSTRMPHRATVDWFARQGAPMMTVIFATMSAALTSGWFGLSQCHTTGYALLK